VSAPQPRGSRTAPALKAGAVFAVFLALFLLFDRLSRPDGPQTSASPTTAPGATSTTTAPTRTTGRPTTTTAPPTTRTTRPPQTTRTTQPPLKSGQGVTLQILNGTGELRLARDFKPLVRRYGYKIVNTGNTGANYPVSTVYYTDANRDDALAFQRRFPAFKIVQQAPANLSRDVELHAIIGANYTPPH